MPEKTFASATGDAQTATDDGLYPCLHLLRVLAALSIFVGHWSEPYVVQLWPQGQIAIDVFFMIEGFLSMRVMTKTAAHTGTGRHIFDRALEIYPTYVIGLLAGFCAFAPFAFTETDGWTITSWLSAFVSGLLLLPTFSTLVHGSVFPLNPPTWAIVLELIGFALLAAPQFRRSISAILLIWFAAILTFAVLAIFWRDPNAGWQTIHYSGGFPRMILSFFGGAALFWLYDEIAPFMPRLSPLWMCVAFVAIHLLRIRFVGWPLLFFGVPLLVALAASSRRPPWSVAAGGWAARHALMIYVLGYPVMMIWRVASSRYPMPESPIGIGLELIAVTATIVVASVAANRIASRFLPLRPHFGAAVSTE